MIMDCFAGRNLFYAPAKPVIKIFANNQRAFSDFNKAAVLIINKGKNPIGYDISGSVINIISCVFSRGFRQPSGSVGIFRYARRKRRAGDSGNCFYIGSTARRYGSPSTETLPCLLQLFDGCFNI